MTMDDTVMVGNDTFEVDWAIPDTLPDGMYTLRATLASAGLGITSVDQEVTINRLAERVEITDPVTRSASPSRFGTIVPLAGQVPAEEAEGQLKPIGNIDGLNTGETDGSGTSRVRAFYTTSPPGSTPAWTVCGTENAPGDALLSGAANDGVRCTLESVSQQTAVTGVALLANNSNRGPYDGRLNQAGDATRVEDSYVQTPTTLEPLGDPVVQRDIGPDQEYGCQEVVVLLTDQYEREIVGANVDVNAVGPSDRLKFDTGILPPYGVVAPARGGHAMELGYDCFGGSDRETPGEQGEHQVIGGPDLKHVESDSFGTEDTGEWGFNLYIPAGEVSDARYITQYVVWLDEGNDGSMINDDGCGADELSTFGSIGWGGDPTVAEAVTFDLHCEPHPPTTCPGGPALPDGTCPTVAPTPSESPSPTPTPTSKPDPKPVRDDITLRASDRKVPQRKAVVFRGRVRSAKASCKVNRPIRLASRRGPGKKFKVRDRTLTNNVGRWSFRRKMRVTSQWRAVARRTPGCPRLRTRILKVSVSRRT